MNQQERETVRALKAEIARQDEEISRLSMLDVNWRVVAEELQRKAKATLDESDESSETSFKVIKFTTAHVLNALARALLVGLLKAAEDKKVDHVRQEEA